MDMNEYDRIIGKATDIFGETAGPVWMLTRNPLLDGVSPLRLCNENRGDEVLALLEGLADGIVV